MIIALRQVGRQVTESWFAFLVHRFLDTLCNYWRGPVTEVLSYSREESVYQGPAHAFGADNSVAAPTPAAVPPIGQATVRLYDDDLSSKHSSTNQNIPAAKGAQHMALQVHLKTKLQAI